MAAFVQAAKGKGGFPGRERRETPRSNGGCRGRGGCRNVEKVVLLLQDTNFGVSPVLQGYSSSKCMENKGCQCVDVRRELDTEPRITLFVFSDLCRFLS